MTWTDARCCSLHPSDRVASGALFPSDAVPLSIAAVLPAVLPAVCSWTRWCNNTSFQTSFLLWHNSINPLTLLTLANTRPRHCSGSKNDANADEEDTDVLCAVLEDNHSILRSHKSRQYSMDTPGANAHARSHSGTCGSTALSVLPSNTNTSHASRTSPTLHNKSTEASMRSCTDNGGCCWGL